MGDLAREECHNFQPSRVISPDYLRKDQEWNLFLDCGGSEAAGGPDSARVNSCKFVILWFCFLAGSQFVLFFYINEIGTLCPFVKKCEVRIELDFYYANWPHVAFFSELHNTSEILTNGRTLIPMGTHVQTLPYEHLWRLWKDQDNWPRGLWISLQNNFNLFLTKCCQTLEPPGKCTDNVFS
jgi:hypothetical protein